MNMAKKAVAVMCGIMIALMSFTLTDLGNAIGGFPAYEEEKGSEKLTISEHGNKSALIFGEERPTWVSARQQAEDGQGHDSFFRVLFYSFLLCFCKNACIGVASK